VSLSTTKYVNPGGDMPLQSASETGWQEIAKGLGLIVRGYCVLVVGGTLGPLFVWLAVNGGAPLPGLNLVREDCDNLLLFGLLTIVATGVLSYSLVLVGQWRCLMYAPERQGAKELMYVCINAVVIGSILNGVGVWVDGARTYAALQRGWDEALALGLSSPGMLLQLVSAGLGLFGSLVFSQFLRNVASCFNDRARMRSVDLNLAFVGLLLGGSVGTALYAHRVALRPELLPWLAGGWLLCFAWHLAVVRGVRSCVEAGLCTLPAAPRAARAPDSPKPGAMTLHSLSGLRRLAKRNADV
jgi:hypothetical protein